MRGHLFAFQANQTFYFNLIKKLSQWPNLDKVADHVTDEDGDYKAEQGEEEDEEELPLRQRRKKRKKAERTRGSKDKKAPPPPPPTFDCEICRKSFRGSVLLANHVANVHQTHPSATEGNVDIKEVKAELFSRLGADRDLEEGQVFPCKVCSVVLKTQVWPSTHFFLPSPSLILFTPRQGH